MPPPKRTKDGLNSRDRAHVQIAALGALARILQTMFKWGGLVGVMYFIYLSVKALSGEVTVAAFVLDFIEAKRPSKWLERLAIVLFAFYGWRQRQLRRKAIERSGQRIKRLESGYDEKRSSSRLDDRGKAPDES